MAQFTDEQIADIRCCVEDKMVLVSEDPEDFAEGAHERLQTILFTLPAERTEPTIYLEN